MPELPEVQTIVNDLAKMMRGKNIAEVVTLTKSIWRYNIPKKTTMAGTAVNKITRRGKYILITLSNGGTLIIHLGMTGRLNGFDTGMEPEKHTHLLIKFDDFDVHFNDIRRFGFVDYAPNGKLRDISYLNKLGPDPFELDEKQFVEIIKSRKRIIKPLLMDQEVISGLGNIYSDEALFKAGIKPLSNSLRIRKIRIAKLYNAVIEVLDDAINARGSSISDYVDGSGTKGNYQNYHSVYGKEGQPCPKCGAKIKRIVLGGRSAHFCPRCQR